MGSIKWEKRLGHGTWGWIFRAGHSWKKRNTKCKLRRLRIMKFHVKWSTECFWDETIHWEIVTGIQLFSSCASLRKRKWGVFNLKIKSFVVHCGRMLDNPEGWGLLVEEFYMIKPYWLALFLSWGQKPLWVVASDTNPMLETLATFGKRQYC